MYYLDNGHYPYSNWASSNNATQWETLSNDIGIDLPVDPINTTSPNIATSDGVYTYSYYAQNFDCHGEWYMLVYRLEGDSSPDSPGVDRCDGGARFNYPGTVTIGVNNVTG